MAKREGIGGLALGLLALIVAVALGVALTAGGGDDEDAVPGTAAPTTTAVPGTAAPTTTAVPGTAAPEAEPEGEREDDSGHGRGRGRGRGGDDD